MLPRAPDRSLLGTSQTPATKKTGAATVSYRATPAVPQGLVRNSVSGGLGVMAVRRVRRRRTAGALLTLLAEFLAIATQLAAIVTLLALRMMQISLGVLQLARFFADVCLVLCGVGRIRLHVLQVLADLRPVMADVALGVTHVVTIVAEILLFVMHVRLLTRRLLPRVRHRQDLHVVELAVQVPLIVPDVVTIVPDLLQIVEDRLLVGRRVLRIGLHVGQVFADVRLVLADLAAVALNALQTLRGPLGVMGERAAVPRARPRVTARRRTVRRLA